MHIYINIHIHVSHTPAGGGNMVINWSTAVRELWELLNANEITNVIFNKILVVKFYLRMWLKKSQNDVSARQERA